jgi:hypothetical protein
MRNELKSANACDLSARLDDIQMPAYERLTARAHLARAEAISDLIVAAVRALQSLAKVLSTRRLRRSLARIG